MTSAIKEEENDVFGVKRELAAEVTHGAPTSTGAQEIKGLDVLHPSHGIPSSGCHQVFFQQAVPSPDLAAGFQGPSSYNARMNGDASS